MKDDEILELLSSDTDDVVPPDHERRIRAGLATALGSAASPTSEPTQVDAPNVRAQALSQGTAASGWTLGKVAAMVVTGVVLATGGFVVGRVTAPRVAVPPAPSASASSAPLDLAPSASFTATEIPSMPAPSASGPRVGPSPERAVDPGFDREQSLLEQARVALLRRDAAAAEQALERCAREIKRPRHGEEADYLRILVARERGDAESVRARARAFLQKYPESLLRARVEPLAH